VRSSVLGFPFDPSLTAPHSSSLPVSALAFRVRLRPPTRTPFTLHPDRLAVAIRAVLPFCFFAIRLTLLLPCAGQPARSNPGPLHEVCRWVFFFLWFTFPRRLIPMVGGDVQRAESVCGTTCRFTQRRVLLFLFSFHLKSRAWSFALFFLRIRETGPPIAQVSMRVSVGSSPTRSA